MRLIADSCPTGPRPRIYLHDDGHLVVQGYRLDNADVPGHCTVRLPSWLIAEAARALPADTIAGPGDTGGCMVRALDDADVLVTGLSDTSVPVPDGEALVRVPALLLARFAAALSQTV